VFYSKKLVFNIIQWHYHWIIHHHNFRSHIPTIGPYHCIQNDQISWKQVWNRPNCTSDGYDLIKTILAWSTTQIQSQIRLHVGSATLDPVPRLDFKTARLNSARLAADDVAGGPTLLMCLLTGRWCVCWHGMPTVHADITIIFSFLIVFYSKKLVFNIIQWHYINYIKIAWWRSICRIWS